MELIQYVLSVFIIVVIGLLVWAPFLLKEDKHGRKRTKEL